MPAHKTLLFNYPLIRGYCFGYYLLKKVRSPRKSYLYYQVSCWCEEGPARQRRHRTLMDSEDEEHIDDSGKKRSLLLPRESCAIHAP